jgi:HEAT repeat protein
MSDTPLPDFEALIAQLHELSSVASTSKARQKATRQLSQHARDSADPRALQALLPLLRDHDVDVLCEAVRALGYSQQPAALAPLLALMDDPHPQPYDLYTYDDRLVYEVTREIVQALGDLGDVRAIPALKNVWSHWHADEMRLMAASALAALGDATGQALLRNSLTNVPAWERLTAAIALSHLRDPAGRALMQETLADAQRWAWHDQVRTALARLEQAEPPPPDHP